MRSYAAILGFFPIVLAAQPVIGFVGVWDRSEPLIADAAGAHGIKVAFFKPEELAGDNSRHSIAEACRVLFILNIQSADALNLAGHWPRQGPKFVPLDLRGSQAPLAKAGLLLNDPEIPKYWRPNGSLNVRRLMAYLKVHYLNQQAEIEPPIDVPDSGYYDPDRPDDAFNEFSEYRTFRQNRNRWRQDAPIAALLIQQSFWITHDTNVVDAEVRALERHGINAVVIFGDRQPVVEKLIRDAHADLVVEDRHGAMWESRDLLDELDVPYLRPISMLGSTVKDWQTDPRGLSYRDVGMFLSLQESWGTLEPIVVGGLQADISGFQLHESVADGIEKFAARAQNWLSLRRKPNREKHIAIVYYNRELGKGDLMQGSATGQFLDGPESLVRFLPRLAGEGYQLTRLPRDKTELLAWLIESGRNVGPWAQKSLEEMVDRGHLPLVPLSTYLRWYNHRLSPENRRAIEKAFGPPPGRLMVVERRGEKQIVIPRVDLGNIILLPQPERGEKQDEALLHSRDVPPPHNYLAFYWWLEEDYHADAVIHWGTHGSLELLPGKEAGLTRGDWSDICAGNLPIIDLWITDNIGEATVARRRSYAQIVDHLPPPAVPAEVESEDENLRADLAKFAALEPGLLKEQYRHSISRTAQEKKLDSAIGLIYEAGKLSDAELRRLENYLHEVAEERTPTSLHVLGQPPEARYLPDYLTAVLGSKYLDHIAALTPPPALPSAADRLVWLRKRGADFLRTHLLTENRPAPPKEFVEDLAFARTTLERLNRSDEEITGLLRALAGRFIHPGPGPDPIRNPQTAPGGRALYALNPEEVPTRQAWDIAVRLIDELWEKRHPRKIALDLNGMDTLRDFGVMEAQIFYLMGVRPVWDRNNLAVDVALIPRIELKRPRIDVFCAMGGSYKENFATRVKLLDKAIRLVSSLDEEDNYLRDGTMRVESRLRERGMTAEQARALAPARIFGTKAGNISGTHILYLIPRSGAWKNDGEISDIYIENMSYVYTGNLWGEKVEGLYNTAVQNSEMILRVWASNMHSQLSNHHAYEYMGGLSMAIAKLTGNEPDAFIADVRDPSGARVRDFQEVLATNMATELLNRKWLEGMKAHGYAGVAHTAELVKNTFGWSVTRKSSVSQQQWNDIYNVLFNDRYQIGLARWMESQNPHAYQEIAATMMEATRKGYWNAAPEMIRKLAKIYSGLEHKYGYTEGLVTGGNRDLRRYVTYNLSDAAPGPVTGRMSHATAIPMSAILAPAVITGERLQTVVRQGEKLASNRTGVISVVLFGVALAGFGFATRRGAI